jgi:hypothetical protein
MFRQSLATLLLLSFLTGTGLAQDEIPELVTDRPDQTESASTVPEGTVQIEIGLLVSRRQETFADVDAVEVPATLVRVGLSENWELRAGWAGHVSIDGAAEGFDVSGFGDAELGFKYRFRDERGPAPEMALLVSTSVPAGDEELSTDELEPALRLAFAHTLSERLSLGYNLGIGWEEVLGSALYSYVYTAALGIGLGERASAFVEIFGDVPGDAPGDPAHGFDGGFTFLLRDNLQLDVAAGVGLSDAADDWFAGLGLSARLPR